MTCLSAVHPATRVSWISSLAADGRFEKPQPAPAAFSEFEDVAVTLFDCDQDRDLGFTGLVPGNQAPVMAGNSSCGCLEPMGRGDFSIDTRARP